ncbi:MAG: diacylglycerol kinase family protein [Rubrobacteraceae bacterium]
MGAGILRWTMEKSVAHLILNPAANKGRGASQQVEISGFLAKRGIRPIWHVTEERGHASEIVEDLPHDALAVAVGGDGTVREVAAACTGTARTLGVLPVGSGNDYVKALGIGTKVGRALEVLTAGNIRTVDAGEANGLKFNNGLGIGFDAEVAAGVSEAPAYLGGVGRYLWSVGRLLWNFECHDAVLKLDDGQTVESKTILVAAALGTTYGARFRLAPRAVLDDGMFDVVWSEEVSRTEVLKLIPRAFGSSLLEHPKIHMARSREIEVTLAEKVPAHVDGEILEPARNFHARVLPGALRIVAPAPKLG